MKAARFLVDLRTPQNELPLNHLGQLVGGYRKVNYKNQPAIETSFGYGYTDYVVDGNPNDYETIDAGGIFLVSVNLVGPVGGSLSQDHKHFSWFA